MDEEVLKRIDTKLNALLALQLETFLRESGLSRRRQRSVDRILADAGLATREIAAVLGKTERAVQLVIAGERRKATKVESPSSTGDPDFSH